MSREPDKDPPISGLDERFLTKSELAAVLRKSIRWVDLEVEKGLPWFRAGRSKLFELSKVLPWLERTYGSSTTERAD